MKKIIILIAFLTLGFTNISIASQEVAKDESEKKSGEKIIITQVVKPEEDLEEQVEEIEQQSAKEDSSKETTTKTKTSESSQTLEKSSDDKKSQQNPNEATKDSEVDMQKVEKVVDDLVKKLDENSNLKKALIDVKSDINTGEKDNKQNPEITKKTEEIIKDYSQKITEAKSPSQKRQLEDEAASIIRNIRKQEELDEFEDSSDKDDDKKDDKDSKKDKLVIEVKSEKGKGLENDKIYALSEDDKKQEKEPFVNKPIIAIGLILLLSILIALGIVIKKRDI